MCLVEGNKDDVPNLVFFGVGLFGVGLWATIKVTYELVFQCGPHFLLQFLLQIFGINHVLLQIFNINDITLDSL